MSTLLCQQSIESRFNRACNLVFQPLQCTVLSTQWTVSTEHSVGRIFFERMLLYRHLPSTMLLTIVLVKEIVADITSETNLTDIKTDSDLPTTPVVSHVFCSSCLNASLNTGRPSHTEVPNSILKTQTYSIRFQNGILLLESPCSSF